MEINLSSIDSFVNVPIIVAAAAGLLIFVLLLISRIRNTSKISLILFPSIIIFMGAMAYTYFSHSMIVLVVALVFIELLLLAYCLVLAVSDPEKRERQKAQAKKEHLSPEEIDNIQLQEENSKYKKIIKANKDLTVKASSFFNSEDTLGSFLEYFNKLVVEKTVSDGCAILVLDAFDNILTVKSVTGQFPPPYKLPEDLPHKPIRIETNFRYSQFALEGNIFGDLFTKGEAVNIKDSVKDKRVFQNGPEDFLKCGPYVFVPIKQDEESTGLVCLARKPGSQPFSQEEFETAISLTDALSTALQPLNSFLSYTEHMELTKEGDIASKYQKAMTPEKMPVINKVSIGKYSVNAENVCGDYYDIIPYRKDRISFVMADVAGKGMNSLVIMIMIRAMIRLVSNTNQSAATLIEWINHAICSEKNSMDHFASVALINYNSIENTAQISTSGINPVILYSAKDDSIKKISLDCEPIGVDKNTEYKNIDINLNAGDIIVTCTDGLLECLNESGVQYSLDNLTRIIKANCKLSGKDIASRVKENVKKFCGNAQQYDDQSLLVIKIQG